MDEVEIAPDAVGQGVLHHLEREHGAPGLDRIDDVARDLDGRLEGAGAEIVGMGAVARAGGERADEAHRAAGADRFGDGEALDRVVETGLPLDRIGIDQVAPDADLGERDIFAGEGGFDVAEARRVGDRDLGDIGRAVAEIAMGAGEGEGIVRGDGKAVATEPDHQTWFRQECCGL